MDPRQSTSKRSVDVMELQNQEDNMASASKETEDGATKTKQLVQELDPLKIPNILEVVFSYLDSESIKNARLVNPLWSDEGAKSLIAKCFVQIPRDSNWDCNEMTELKEFLSLKSSDRSRIPNITIRTLDDFEVWNSLRVFGAQAKSVKFKIVDHTVKLLHYSSNVVPDILIEELKFDFVPGVLVQVPDLEDRLAKTLNKLVSTNQFSLKRLTLINWQHFLSLLEFPCMTALTHMDLDFSSGCQMPGCQFPPSLQFSKKLPNLQEISLKFKTPNSSFYPADGFLQHLFENTGKAPSVKCVKFLRDYQIHNETVEFLFEIFPNVEDLQLCVNWRSQMWFAWLWTFGENLKRLRLYFDDFEFRENFDLDSFFTGFTPETVDFIKDDPNLEPDSLEKLEQLRVKPSILNLKELEHLTMDLDLYRLNLRYLVPDKMLAVAGKYAFKLLPKKPKIIIRVKESRHRPVANAVMGALKEVSQLANDTVEKY